MMKAQATLEMIVSVGLLLLIFIILSIMALEKSTDSSELKTFLDVKRTGESMKDNINMISQQGPGYYKYFSLPERTFGDYEYNVTIYKNILEILWADRLWSTQLMTTNVTVYSLDKGLAKRNRIMNDNGVIEITGHRPNLKPDCNTLNITVNGTTINATFEVLNDAHVDDSNVTYTGFTQICGGVYNETVTVPMAEIPAFGRILINLNYTEQCASSEFSIRADYNNQVLEGIESDNECNATVA